MRRRLVVGAVLAVGFVVTGPARAGPEPARLVSEQELPPVYAQGVARAGDRWVVSGLNVLAHLTDDLVVDAAQGPATPPGWSARGYNHVGDIDVARGVVYAPLEQPDYERGVQATATFDAESLEFLDAIELPRQSAATDPPASATRPSASDDLDPGWPPVLIAAVLAAVAAAAIVGVTFYRRARAAARGR